MTQMPYVLRPEVKSKWKRLADEGNLATGYSLWSLTADPAWFPARSVSSCLQAYLATEDQKWLDLALDDYVMMPDVTTGVLWGHLTEIGYAMNYLLIEEYLSEEKKTEWQRRLKALAERMISHNGSPAYRIGDWDQCITYLIYWMILDKYLGTNYVSRVPDCVSYVADFMKPEHFEGGPTDPSSFYELSTGSLIVWGAAILGKDFFPWFDSWATQYANFLLFSVDATATYAVAWGDMQPSDGLRLDWHRITLTLLLAGMGYRTNELISFAKRFLNPNSLYPYGGNGWQLVLDPEVFAAQKEVIPLEDGAYICKGIGLVIHRRNGPKGGSYFWAYCSRPIADDHHYECAQGTYNLVVNGEKVIDCPMGYAQGGHISAGDSSAAWYNHNALAVGPAGFFWNRRISIAVGSSEGGVSIEGIMEGPHERYLFAKDGTLKPPGPNDFRNNRVTTSVTFDPDTLTITCEDYGTIDKETFPEWAKDEPGFSRMLHTNKASSVDGWTSPKGNKVEVKITGATPVLDSKGRILSTTDDMDLEVLTEIKVTPLDVIPPPPDDEEPEPELDTFIIDNKDPGFSVAGEWIHWPGQGYGDSVHFAEKGTGDRRGFWRFRNLKPGLYKIYATWTPFDNRASNARYNIDILDESFWTTVNQKLAPTDGWEFLGQLACQNSLDVSLSNNADNFVIADAIKIVRVSDLPPPPPDEESKLLAVYEKVMEDGSKQTFEAYTDKLIERVSYVNEIPRLK
jgi:hypothetical protein